MIKLALLVIHGVVTVAGAVTVPGPQARARRQRARGAAQTAERGLVTLTGTVRAIGEPRVAADGHSLTVGH